MKVKTLLYDTADILVIMFATSSIILIIAKLYNFSFVKDIDSTTLVAIPASIFAYFTYKISKKQTHQMIIRQYTEHMEDFFDTWTRYQNSFPLPKYLGIMKDIENIHDLVLPLPEYLGIMNDINENINDVIQNYSELKNKLFVLNLRAGKFDATEITSAMQSFWNKFLESQKALLIHCIWDQRVKEIESYHESLNALQTSGTQVEIDQTMSVERLNDCRIKRNEASTTLSDNVMYFFLDGINEMNNAYDKAIRKLQ